MFVTEKSAEGGGAAPVAVQFRKTCRHRCAWLRFGYNRIRIRLKFCALILKSLMRPLIGKRRR